MPGPNVKKRLQKKLEKKATDQQYRVDEEELERQVKKLNVLNQTADQLFQSGQWEAAIEASKQEIEMTRRVQEAAAIGC
jgi:hypothetical protein